MLGAPLAAASLVAVATLASLAIASSSATPGVDFSPRHPLLGGAPYRDVRIPTRGISMHRASRPSDFCALRDVHPRGSWRGRDSGSVPKSTLSVEWPTEEGVARSRAACETPLIRRLQDSGEFVDAFCFVVHPGSTTKLGRVDFDVEPLCDSSYNFNKDVVPGVPAFLAVAATRLTCQVTALVGMYDLDGLRENSGYAPLPEETQRALAAARTPLLVHQTASFDERSATWMPDFYFLRSRGFREGGFGDATLEEMGVAGGGEVGGREEALERIRARWRRKRRSAFWRGSPTGRGRCEDFERLRLASLSRSVDGLDAGLIRDGNNYFCGDDSLTRMLGERWWADEHHVSERDWLEHRAIIDVDGVANAWGRYWRLASDSVVVSLESPIRRILQRQDGAVEALRPGHAGHDRGGGAMGARRRERERADRDDRRRERAGAVHHVRVGGSQNRGKAQSPVLRARRREAMTLSPTPRRPEDRGHAAETRRPSLGKTR